MAGCGPNESTVLSMQGVECRNRITGIVNTAFVNPNRTFKGLGFDKAGQPYAMIREYNGKPYPLDEKGLVDTINRTRGMIEDQKKAGTDDPAMSGGVGQLRMGLSAVQQYKIDHGMKLDTPDVTKPSQAVTTQEVPRM